MRVRLLGTGAADGWPNPFCVCGSCQAQRATGRLRVSTSVLVDDVLLLDLGPDTPRQAERLGVRLDRVRHVLVTHAHPDHLAPAGLLWRQWAGGPPVQVAGPAPVVEEVRRWLGPGSTVTLRELDPGDVLDVGPYTVRALPAVHEEPCLLYEVTGPDGDRLLYATDTGPLDATALAMLDGAALDLLLLEQTFGARLDHGTGHHDLGSFPRTLAELRRRGAVHAGTRVVAVHLGHHNPPERRLRDLLEPWGAEPGEDGAVLELAPAAATAPATPPAPHRTLLLGGARSGKSAAAEALLAGEPEVVYAATGPVAGDPEWAARVDEHRRRRPAGWHTVETTDLEPLLTTPGPPLLVDCLTLWLTGVLDEAEAWARWDEAAEAAVQRRVTALAEAWRATPRRVVAVSNEVGSGVVPDTVAGRLFRDLLGRLNAAVAAESDEVRLLVAGLPVPLAGQVVGS